jgi:SAM-dependent methyltransferase
VPPEIIALAETLPPGRALDLGCGTGTTSLYLAERGWQVCGIDYVPTAIYRARKKARQARLTVDFHIADVTRMDFLHGPFDLGVDIGCLHRLNLVQQQAYAAHLTRLLRPNALFALYAFAPRILHGHEVGLSYEDLIERFSPPLVLERYVPGYDRDNRETGAESAWCYLRRAES